MILVGGLTPAWQQILLFERLELGEVNRAAQAHWCASGKVLNVALGLARLGAQAQVIAPLGGAARRPIECELAAAGVDCVTIATSAPTRVCTTLLERAERITTELVENARDLAAEELAAYRAQWDARRGSATTLVVSGSLPAGTPVQFCAELLAECRANAVLDLRGAELIACLEHRPLVVKPNREELARTLGRPLASDADLLAAMRELCRRGAQWVVVTQGSRPVWAVSAQAAWQLAVPPVEQVINPIGSGDSFAAALAWGLDRGQTIEHSLRLAVAAGAENVRTLLPAQLDPERVEALAQQVRLEALVRS